MYHRAYPPLRRRAQRGVSLIFALIALVTLMLGSLALVRHVDTATQLLGNLGYKQDATSAADQATRVASDWLRGNLAALNTDIAETGYYASNREFADDGTTLKMPIDVTGEQLKDTSARQLIDWDRNGCTSSAADSYTECSITPPPTDVTVNGNTAKYVILRLCNKIGDPYADSTIKCTRPLNTGTGESNVKGDKTFSEGNGVSTSANSYFRILVRVTGFRNTTSVTETIVHF